MVLPYARQSISEEDVAAVATALSSDFLTTGPEVGAYEADLAGALGSRHVKVCNSGTAALHLALLAMGVGPGDNIIVPTVTFLATANAVRMCGANVVFADVDPKTGLVTKETMAEALERASAAGRTRAAFAVHLNGQLCDVDELASVLNPVDVALLEDAAHALGAEYRWDVAAPSRLACFSTHPVKSIATGEGGFVATNDAALAEAVERFRSHGITRNPAAFSVNSLAFDDGVPNPWHYEMHEVGWNYRLPDILCALGRSQLRQLPRFMERRRTIAARYDAAFGPMSPHLETVPRGGPDGLHLYPILIDFSALGTTRRRVMERLRQNGVGTQVHYMPVHLQPYYRAASPTRDLPGAMAYFERCLSIPFYPGLTDSDVDVVIGGIAQLFREGT